MRLRKDGVYVFVGKEVYSFTPSDVIHHLVSSMGNSAVTYPLAVGRENTYLMGENTYIPNVILSSLQDPSPNDPYHILYAIDLYTGVASKSDRVQNKSTQLWKSSHKLSGRRVLHKRLWS